MFNGKHVIELSMSDVAKYYSSLREKSTALSAEEEGDYKICKERLITFAYNILADTSTNEDMLTNIIDVMFEDNVRLSVDKHGYLHLRGANKDWLNKPYEG